MKRKMKKYSQAAVLFCTAFLAAVSLCKAVFDSNHCQSYPCLLWEDNFDFFNFSTWGHELTAYGGGNGDDRNGEFQYYTNNRSNSYVKNGKLHIRPTFAEDKFGKDWPYYGKLDYWGAQPADLCTGNTGGGCLREAYGSQIVNPIQSARIQTSNSFSFRYGRLEVEAKMPQGDWIWPAIWLLPKYQKYGIWPTSGEIELVESRGNAELYDHVHGFAVGTPTVFIAVCFNLY